MYPTCVPRPATVTACSTPPVRQRARAAKVACLTQPHPSRHTRAPAVALPNHQSSQMTGSRRDQPWHSAQDYRVEKVVKEKLAARASGDLVEAWVPGQQLQWGVSSCQQDAAGTRACSLQSRVEEADLTVRYNPPALPPAAARTCSLLPCCIITGHKSICIRSRMLCGLHPARAVAMVFGG